MMKMNMMKPYRDLPPFTLNDVGIGYLVKLIPLLVSMTSSGAPPSFDNEKDKPVWWPEDIEWINPKIYLSRMQFSTRSLSKNLEVLRKVVLSCYEYHGVEALLTRLEETPVSEPEGDGEVEMEPVDIIQLGDDGGEEAVESSTESDGMVFVCCFCLEQFSSHEGVSKHQTSCEKGVTETNTTCKNSNDTSQDSCESEADQASQESPLPGNEDELSSSPEQMTEMSPQPALSPSSSSSSTMEVAVQHSERSNISSPVPPPNKTSTERQVTASSAPAKSTSTTPAFVPLLKTRSQKRLEQIMDRHKARQLMIKECREMKQNGMPEGGAWWVSRHRRKRAAVAHPDSYATKELFALGLGLSEKVKADLMKDAASKKSQEVDLDCVIVGVEGPLGDRPCPSSPVLSPVGPSPRTQKSLMSQLSRSDGMGTCRRRVSFCFVEDEWADKEAMENGRDPLALSILSLPFSSPLGQRVKKYAKGEGHLNIIKDPELYCKTEGERECGSKLRFRASEYRISYRKKRRASNFVHKYKFNQEDRREFKIRMKTGLSARARYLLSQMKEFRVKLSRLTKKEIKDWTEGKVITIEEKIYFDDDICITQIDIPESKVGKKLANHPILGKHLAVSSQPVAQQVQSAGVKPQTSLSSQRHQALPPHVPNIFRNRTGYTASPPRVPPFPLRHSLLQDALHNSKVRPQPMSRPQLFAGGRTPLYGRQRPESPSNHRPGPACRTPCSKPFVSSLGHSNYRASLGSINNRRKQQMTHVRNDDADASTSSFAFAAQNYVPIGSQLNHQGSSQSPIVSTDGEQKRKAASLTSLSNFDYFSIRDGVLKEGCSLASSFTKNASALKCFQSKLLPLPYSSSPTNSQFVSSTNYSSLSRGLRHSGLRNGVEHREHNAPDVQHTVMPPQVPLVNNSPHLQEGSDGKKEPLLQSQPGVVQKKRTVDDDDILEVICIDDD